MAPHDEDDHPSSQKQVEAFLGTLRQSTQMAHELLRTTAQQEARMRSLEDDLANARSRVAFLEQETANLRDRLVVGVPDHARLAALEELMDEQNCLAQLLVTTDRLAQLSSTKQGMQLAVEILHNLIGAHRYAIYLVGDDGRPALVAPIFPKEREGAENMADLVAETIAKGRPCRPTNVEPSGVPAAWPLRLGRQVVGVLVIIDVIPHMGATLGRLQTDLLDMLSERFAPSVCRGALHEKTVPETMWPAARASIATVDASSGASS